MAAEQKRLQKEQELRETKKRKAEEEKLQAKIRAQKREELKLKKIAEQEEKQRSIEQKRLVAEEKRQKKEQAFREQQKLKAQKEKNKLLEKRKIAEEKKRLEQIEKDLNEGIQNKKLAEFKVINKNELSNDVEKEKQKIVVQKLNQKVLFDELARKRDEEIKKRKFSNYNAQNEKEKSDDNTKYFFDETVVQNFSSKSDLETEISKSSIINKKALIKKNVSTFENQKKEKLVTAFNSKKPIIKLKDKKFVEKTETFYYEDDNVELDINQKMKISDYVNQIIDKPIKIEIKPNYILQEKNSKKVKHLAKSRSLLIRAYLLKLGISHNRINILMEESLGEKAMNEVVINFIEL